MAISLISAVNCNALWQFLYYVSTVAISLISAVDGNAVSRLIRVQISVDELQVETKEMHFQGWVSSFEITEDINDNGDDAIIEAC